MRQAQQWLNEASQDLETSPVPWRSHAARASEAFAQKGALPEAVAAVLAEEGPEPCGLRITSRSF